MTGKLFDSIHKHMKIRKKGNVGENTADIVFKILGLIKKVCGMIIVLALVGFALFCFYKGGIVAGIIMLLCAVFFYVVFK